MNALITGAGGSLGRAVVERFAADGHAVVGTVSPGKEPGYSVKGNVHFLQADLSSEQAASIVVEEAVRRLSRLDAAVLTVGGFTPGTIQNTRSEVLHKMFTLNFETAFNMARPLFLHMADHKGGKIVLIGARTARIPAQGKNALAYSLSKSLIFSLSDLLNAEGAGKGVTSTVIVPSTIDTPDNRKAMPDADFSAWTRPEIIAQTITSLVTGKSAYMPVVDV
jgi:NAD(P)-dependent dehydrogenase (short-subunit alcohol dehydrogenase family)